MGNTMADATQWAMIGTGVSVALRVLVSLAWLGLIVGVVWKSRPDAARVMLIGVLLGLVQTCGGSLVSPLLNLYIAPAGGGAALLRANTLVQIAMSVTGLAPQALLIAGIALLARPARRDVRDPDV